MSSTAVVNHTNEAIKQNFLFEKMKYRSASKIYTRSVRKSGTHLLKNIIDLLEIKRDGNHHFYELGLDQIERSRTLDTQKKYCLLYRDPRDAMMSLILRKTKKQTRISFSMDRIHKAINHYLSFPKVNSFQPPQKQIEDFETILYLKKHRQKNFLFIKFEDIIPDYAGGPSQKRRFETFKKICTFANKKVSDEKIYEAMEKCWGNSGTFRANEKKKVGQWTKYLTPKQIKKVHKKYNYLLLGLGYETDPNWHRKYLNPAPKQIKVEEIPSQIPIESNTEGKVGEDFFDIEVNEI